MMPLNFKDQGLQNRRVVRSGAFEGKAENLEGKCRLLLSRVTLFLESCYDQPLISFPGKEKVVWSGDDRGASIAYCDSYCHDIITRPFVALVQVIARSRRRSLTQSQARHFTNSHRNDRVPSADAPSIDGMSSSLSRRKAPVDWQR